MFPYIGNFHISPPSELQSVNNISSPPTSTSSTMPPKSSKTAGAEALKKGTAQPIGNFFKAQKKAGRPKTAGNLSATCSRGSFNRKSRGSSAPPSSTPRPRTTPW